MKRILKVVPEPGPTPEAPNPFLRWTWGFFLFFLLLIVPLTQPKVSVTLSNTREYQSQMRIAGIPVVALGAHPNGIIAVGGRPTGVIAIGGIAFGVVAIGGLAFGAIAIGGLSLAVLALGGGAIGWWALGGGAAGRYALGGFAFGDYAYAGNGVAYGYHEASGHQKEKLLE